MIDLRIIYDVEGWAYSHAARALSKYAPPDFLVSIAPLKNSEGQIDLDLALGEAEPDIVFTMHTKPSLSAIVHEGIRAKGWNPTLIGAWNSGYPLEIQDFPIRHAQVDMLLLNNKMMWDLYQHLPRLYLCQNGVDLDIFQVQTAIAQRQHKVLWCGSYFWRQVKGYDDILQPLASRLAARGIDYDFRLVDSVGKEKWPLERMAEWYNTGTIQLCASTSEGTPNTTLEAAACGCVVVSTPVGNMPELIESGRNGFLVERTVDAMEQAILAVIPRYADMASQLLIDIKNWSWEFRSEAFFAAFRHAWSERNGNHPTQEARS